MNIPKVQVVAPSDPDFKEQEKSREEMVPARKLSTMFYDEIMREYNKAPPKAILKFQLLPNVRFGNLKNILACRGLLPDTDFALTRASEEGVPRADQPVVLKKLTKKEGRVLDRSGEGAET